MASLPLASAGAAPQPAMASDGANVEGQPNGDTIPAEQAGSSEASGAAGSCQSDQIVQKIEEVLSGALGTELQCNPDVDKNTVKSNTQSTKRSSTGEDEIPRKKAKKNKKHKSKKKKKKKKKRKKEKKHKKQPKESKLSARPGEPADVQPAPHLMPEQSGSQLNVQHGVFAEASLAGHVQPELCSKPAEGPDNQALGLVSHSVTDSQQSAENLGSGEGTLCATNPPFNLESIQSNIPENTSIAQTRICTSEEQIQQSHENIYPVAINASVADTGNYTWSSKSEIQKDSVEAPRDSEITLSSQGIGEVKALDTALQPEAMEVLTYSEASLQSVSQSASQGLETASESVSLASGVTAIPSSANWAHPSAVTVAHTAVAGQEVKIPETTEISLHMGNVRSVERPLELGGVSRTLESTLQPSVISGNLSMTQGSCMEGSSVLKAAVPLQHPLTISAATPVTHIEIKSAKTPLGPEAVAKMKDMEPAMGNVKALETAMEPAGVTVKDVRAAHGSLQGKNVEGTTGPATALGASEMFLQHRVLTETWSVDRSQGSALPAGLTGVNVVAEAEGLRAAPEPAVVVQTFIPRTVPEVQMAEGFRSPQAKDSEGTPLLRESRPEGESHVRGLAPALSLQQENTQGLGGVLRPAAVVEANTFTTASMSLQVEGVKASEEAVHYGTVASPGLVALERTPEPVVAHESMESVRDAKALAGVMLWQTTAEREGHHASQTESSIIAQPQVMTHTRTSQTEVLRERKDSELTPEAEMNTDAILEPVQTSETSSESVQEHIVGHSGAVLESLPRVEENNMASGILTELTDVQTQGSAVEHGIAARTTTQGNELSEMGKANYLEPTSEAGGVSWLESMKESAAVEVKGSGRGKELEVPVGDASAVPEYLHPEKQEELQAVLEAKPAAEWKSSEEAPEILGACEIKPSEAVPEPEDVKSLETALKHEMTAEVQYVEGVQSQQVEDMLIDKEDAEQTQTSEPLVAETVFTSSHAAEEEDSAGTPVAEAQGLETAPQTDVELKDAEAAVQLEAETKDLEAAAVPETDAEAGPEPIEEGQLEDTPEAEDVKEATPEEDSEKRDSETSDVQPDVAARMKETLMRLENVIEKSSHRTSEKKHDSKKQKRSRSKSQSRSRKRKKKSRSRSTSRRLTSKRARSRSRNYSVSRKKHSKSRSRSVEKRERRVSSRRSRRRRSRSSDRYRSKSRSAEKRLSSGRSRRRRSRSSDHYRSKSRSAEKRLSSRRSRRRRSRSSDRYRSKSRSVEKRLSSRRSGRRRSRSSDRYRSKSRSAEKRLSSRRSGRRRSRSSDRYRSKSRSAEKRLSSRRSGRRRSRSSDRYRSKSRSAEKRLSSRRSGRRRSRSSDRYRSKSRSVEKRLSSWRSRRRHSRSSDRSKSRSRSSEKGGGKEYSWRFRHRSGSSDRSKSRSRSVEKRGRKASVRRSKRQRSKSSDRYKSRSRSVEKRDRKQSSRKSKRQRSKSSDRYKSRSKSVEKKKESSRKSKRRRSKSSERYKSRSRSVEKKRKESSKKSKRKRSKSSDSIKSRSKSVEKKDKLSSAKSSSKHVESSELQESAKGLDKVVPESSFGSEGKSSNGPTSVALSDEGVNGPVLPPSFGSGFSKTSESLEQSSSFVGKTADLQHSPTSEFDTSKTADDQELRSTSVEKTQDSELSMTSENGSTEKTAAVESSLLPELPYSTSESRSSSVEKRGDLETSSVTEFHLSASREDGSRTAPLKEVEGPELPPALKRDMQSSSLLSEGGVSNLSDSHESRHVPGEHTEVLQVPEHESSRLADSPGAVEPQRPFLPPEMIRPVIPDGCESSQVQEPSLASGFMSPDGHGSRSSFAAPIEELPLSVGESFKSPHGNEQRFLSAEKVKAPDVSLTPVCGSVEVSADLVSVSSFEVHESRSSVDKGLDGPTLPQVLEVDCSRSSEMHESRYLTGKIDGAGSLVLSKSGIPICHDGHKAKYNSFEQTESAELSVASELRCSIFPEGCKLTSAAVEKGEIQKPPLSLDSGFSVSADGCESVGTPEKLQPPVTALTSEGGILLLPDSHELRPIPAEKVELLNSSDLKHLASPDGYKLRSAYSEEIQVHEPSLILESRCAVASDGHELPSTPFERAEEPSQVLENEYTVGLDGPELTSTPAEKTELRRLYQMSEERCLESTESQDLQSPSDEKVQQPALVSENEYAVSWVGQELRSSSPEKAEMQQEAVVPDSAASSEDHRLPSLLAGKPEVQECSLLPENEYGVSPEGQEVMASPAEKEAQEPCLTPGSEYSIFHQGRILQSGLTESTAGQELVLVPGSQYAASPEGQELLCTYTEKSKVQECSLLAENEYRVSPERHNLRSSPAEKELEEPSEASESESSIYTDSPELQSAVAAKTEVQELSLSEGECPMTPEAQELQSSPAGRVVAKAPSLTCEHALSSEEYELRSAHAEKPEGVDSALTAEHDHLFFESQEVSFTSLQKEDVREHSPTPENEHGASPDRQELRFTTDGKVDGLEPLTLNDRASMSPDDSHLKSIPVEKMDHAMPALTPEGGCSMSPDNYSVRSGPGEETGDLEPPLRSERRYSTSSYQEGHELKSPMEEEGLESSVTSEHRRSVSPESHDQKSTADEEIDEERRSTSPDEHESRSSTGEEAEDLEQPLTTERRCSESSDEHESRSTAGEEAEDAEASLAAERRDSVSSDDRESRSAAGEDVEDGEPSLTAERRHSTSSDDRESRSTADEEAEDLTAEHRSVSPDGRESRSTVGEEAEDQELSLTTERRHSTSSDEHESRSTAGEDAEDVEPSSAAEQRDSTSSDEQESRSTAGEEAEDVEPLTAEDRRSASPDGAESRSTTGEEEGEDAEPSLTAEQRESASSDEHESESSSGEEEGEDAEPSLADEDKQDSVPVEQSEEQDSSLVPESRRSESSEREKSRSKSVDKASDKESPQRSVSRHSKSPAHPKSRSTSVEKPADKESVRRYRRRRSRSTARQRSQSTSVEKTADKESSRRSRRRRSRSAARQRSQSKSVEKTADKESSRRSRSRRSRSSQRRSKRYDTDSRSRRNRSRSATRRRASRSRSSSLSRSRHRRRSRSRSASRRRRSLSRDRRKRSQRNRSRSTDRRRRRSDSRDRRISLRLRSRSRTPLRQRRSRSRGRRRSSSRSPIRLRRSRSSGRRRYSRSPDRRRSRSSEFSSRSPKRLTDLDKAQLLEIAKANAAAMCAKSGVPLPPSLMPLLSQKKDDKANQKSSRDTLKELTEKCKKIAQSTDDVIVNKPHVSDEEEEERPFYNHPFKLSEPKPIFFNLSTPSIKPAPPPQPKNQVSLSKEFPVSSGSQHRKKEADSVYGEWVPVDKNGKDDGKDDVFPKPAIECVDITTAMNDRAVAQKRLNENSFDLEAMCMLNRAQEQIDAWAQSNSIPGQFTGSTGAQILSSDELTNSGPQAWIRKDQFLRAAPVTGGMGAQLMRKMGWREGEGLGKNKEGSVEPIMVDFKTDRKGLVAVGEKAQKRSGHYVVMKDLSGKHPVSALMEICNKRRWTPPEFVLVDDSGPDHRKHFIFKVRVNGNEYRPTFASLNKKHAKATAATAALQAMGLVPKESMVNTTMFRSASHR